MGDKRLIDGDALIRDARETHEFQIDLGSVSDVEYLIRSAPTIDAVEVVRCRECKHRGYDACPMCHDEYYYDEDDGADFWTVDNTDDNGFCHKGAKMDGGAE